MKALRIYVIPVMILAVLFLGTLAAYKYYNAVRPLTRTSTEYLDTVCTVTIYDDKDSSLMDGAFAMLANYDRQFGMDRDGGDVWRINHANGAATVVDPDTYTLIDKAIAYSAISGGKFDITIGAVSSLWDFTGGSAALPDPDKLAAALALVGWQRVQLNPADHSVTVGPGMMLDLGAIAKGFIADQIASYLQAGGVHSAIVDLGGNIYVIGDKAGKPFSVGVRQPFTSPARAALTLDVTQKSVVTSASDQRYFYLNGQLYHHILDPATGYPADSGLQSVTIVSDSSTDGDALSTICFLLGEDGARALLSTEQFSGIGAVFIRDGGSVSTYGVDGYVQQETTK